MKRLLKLCRTWWRPSLNSPIFSASTLRRLRPHRIYNWENFDKCIYWNTSQGLKLRSVSELPSSVLPTIAAGAFAGMGLLEMAHADTYEEDAQTRSAPESLTDYGSMEKIVRQERERLEELLRKKGMQRGSYPYFSVAVKGQQVTVKFRISPTCEVSRLIVDLVSRLGLKAKEPGGGSEMMLRAWDNAVAWQVILNHPEKHTETGRDGKFSEDKNKSEGNLCVLIFDSLIGSDNAEIEFIKQGSFSPEELDAMVSALKIANGNTSSVKAEKKSNGYLDRRDKPTPRLPSIEKSLAALEDMGVRVFGAPGPNEVSGNDVISWDNIAGYDQQKREIEDTVLLALHSPEIYDNIARGTRHKFESNRPRAVLFEGPPGTGKTSCARVIANQAGVLLLYVPLEAVLSKYYGESERLLGTVFTLANELPNGAIVFLDEVDSFAAARDNEMHEATRRILSVLLRQIDGFEQDKRVVVIAATNRKQDLDLALISRFDSIIAFGLPDQQNREEIVARYARHLKKEELAEFGAVSAGMSGRDIRDVCQQAERRWASKIIRGQAPSGGEDDLPPIQEYIECAEHRRKTVLDIQHNTSQNSYPILKKQPMAFSG